MSGNICLILNKNVMSEEMRIRRLAEKIARDFELTIKDRTDAILQLSASAEANLGTDSTSAEKKKVKSDNKYLYKLIRQFNETDGNLLLNHIDS